MVNSQWSNLQCRCAIYTESMSDADNTWTADNWKEFKHPGKLVLHAPSVDGVRSQGVHPYMPRLLNRISLELAGLFIMGLNGVSYPYSFGSRGMPPVMSSEIRDLHRSRNASKEIPASVTTHITMDQLRTKRAQLLIEDDEHTPALIKELGLLLDLWPRSNHDPQHRRMVFWTLP